MCQSNYKNGKKNHVVSFLNDEHMRRKWIQFVKKKCTRYSCFCSNHFNERYLIQHKKKVLTIGNAILTIYFMKDDTAELPLHYPKTSNP